MGPTDKEAQEIYLKDRAKEVELEEATTIHTDAQLAYLSAMQQQKGMPGDEDFIKTLKEAREELKTASNSLLELTTEKE